MSAPMTLSQIEGADLLDRVKPLMVPLRRYLRRLVRDNDLAEDLLQDSMERVITHWSTRREIQDTRQWVFSIAHNLAVNALREQGRRGLHMNIDDLDEMSMVVPARQEDRVRHHELMRALQGLPKDQLATILLITLDDRSYAEAAKALDVPIGTVMSRLARARQRLRLALEGGLASRLPPTRALA